MDKSVYFFFSILLMCFISACSDFDERISVRASFTQTELNPLGIVVTVGDEHGMALSAARVIVSDPAGGALLLPFYNEKQAYADSIYAAGGGTYHVSVSVGAGGTETNLDVPYVALSSKPEIVSLTDSGGASALSGQSLSASSDIALAWTPVSGATLYIVSVIGQGAIVYTGQSSSGSIIIPAASLAAGIYSVRVEAQAISGDPLLGDLPYYAVSSRNGASIVATLE